ncbi:MAG TPA: DNA gyrase modulator, partial [Sphingomonas sp.]
MHRRDFLAAGGLVIGAGALPPFLGHAIAAQELETVIDVAVKKRLSDAALNAAKGAGASYTDVRVGRYLRQFVVTREANVQNVVNTESTGVGIRVIADGAWGFAATNDMSVDAVAQAGKLAVAIAKANAKSQTSPVRLAPTPGVGEVSWKTPIAKNGMAVPVKEKVDLLLGVNAAAMAAGAKFINSTLFLVNEQKYFASSDGSYIDQDVHRIWAPFTVTAIDQATGKFRSREGLSAPMGLGYEYLDGRAKDKFVLPNGVVNYGNSYDMKEDAIAAAKQAREKLTAASVKPGKYDLVLEPNHLGL